MTGGVWECRALMVSGQCLYLEPKDKESIVKVLEDLGYSCVEDESRVDDVCN
jgi:hypothetical protein